MIQCLMAGLAVVARDGRKSLKILVFTREQQTNAAAGTGNCADSYSLLVYSVLATRYKIRMGADKKK
jgi:hypothetical protein